MDTEYAVIWCAVLKPMLWMIFQKILQCQEVPLWLTQLLQSICCLVARGSRLGFGRGCSAPPVDSKCYKGPKRGGGNYTFRQILTKNRGRNTFSSFLLKYRGRNYTNFLGAWKKGSKWRSICNNLHRMSTLPTGTEINFKVIKQFLLHLIKPRSKSGHHRGKQQTLYYKPDVE